MQALEGTFFVTIMHRNLQKKAVSATSVFRRHERSTREYHLDQYFDTYLDFRTLPTGREATHTEPRSILTLTLPEGTVETCVPA